MAAEDYFDFDDYWECREAIGSGFSSGAWCRRCGRFGLWVMTANGTWRIDHKCTVGVASKAMFDVIADDDK